MRVQRHLGRAPSGSDAMAWIFRIATNVCLNQIRDRRRRDTLQPDPPPPDRSAEDAVIDRNLAAQLAEHLPPKIAAPAWLHYVDGIEQGEVARILGVTRRTVTNRLAVFQKNARKFLERTGS